VALVGPLAVPAVAAYSGAQAPASAGPSTVLRAARMIDPKSGDVMQNPVVVIQGGRITSVGANAAIPAGAKVVDLGSLTLLLLCRGEFDSLVLIRLCQPLCRYRPVHLPQTGYQTSEQRE